MDSEYIIWLTTGSRSTDAIILILLLKDVSGRLKFNCKGFYSEAQNLLTFPWIIGIMFAKVITSGGGGNLV